MKTKKSYKDSILEKIEWSKCKLTERKDKSNDLIIRVPLDLILDRQAKRSFVTGAHEALLWLCDLPKGKPITEEDIKQFLVEYGVIEK